MKNKGIQQLTMGAVIAALYVVLCVVFEPISYGGVQVRIAEALTVLPMFTPAAIPGVTIGCAIANVIGGGIVLDVVFGSLATLIGAIGTYILRKKSVWIAQLPPVVANTIIVPFVLKYGYGLEMPIPLLMLTIAAGEIVGCMLLGAALSKGMKKAGISKFFSAQK